MVNKWIAILLSVVHFSLGVGATLFYPELRAALYLDEPFKGYAIAKRMKVPVFGDALDASEVGISDIRVSTIVQILNASVEPEAHVHLLLPQNRDLEIYVREGYIVSYGWQGHTYKILAKRVDVNSGTVILDFYKNVESL